MNLQELIDRGEELKSEPYNSPKVDLWKNDLKAAVTQYGEATLKILDKALWFGRVITSDQQAQTMHVNAIDKVQELLKELSKRNAEDSQMQSQLINQKTQEAKATLSSKFNKATFNINGPTTFGDNSPANNLQVSELMLAIISQAEEELPDGPEKENILSSLKSIVSNPTFAAIAGASLPEILKRLVG